MFHSHIGFYLNCGLLSPMQAVDAAVDAYDNGLTPAELGRGVCAANPGLARICARVILAEMPVYKDMNLQAERPLPQFFWDSQTDTNCLHQCFSETSKECLCPSYSAAHGLLEISRCWLALPLMLSMTGIYLFMQML